MRIMRLRGISPSLLIRRLWRSMSQNNTFGNAAELAYFFLLSLFPLLIFFASLLGYLPIPHLFDRILSSLARVMPPEAIMLISNTLKQIINNQHGGLLSFGILAAIWTASAGVNSVITLLNEIYQVNESRPYWRVKLTSILTTIALAIPVALALVLVVLGDHIGNWLSAHFGFGAAITILWKLIKWIVALFALFFALELIYYFGPDVEQEWQWITPGSALAVIIWLVATFVLSIYVKHFANYNATYGSLGAVIILMLWFYTGGFAILVGGQLNAIIEHQAATGKAPGEKFPGEKFIERRKGERRANYGEQLRPV